MSKIISNTGHQNCHKNRVILAAPIQVFDKGSLLIKLVIELDMNILGTHNETKPLVFKKKQQEIYKIFYIFLNFLVYSQTTAPCDKLDLLFLIDSSNSLSSSSEFDNIKNFVKDVMDDVTVSQTDTRVAIAPFSDKTARELQLNGALDRVGNIG